MLFARLLEETGISSASASFTDLKSAQILMSGTGTDVLPANTEPDRLAIHGDLK